MQFIKRFIITMATLSSAHSSTSPPSAHTVNTSSGACLVTRDTGARYTIIKKKIQSTFIMYNDIFIHKKCHMTVHKQCHDLSVVGCVGGNDHHAGRDQSEAAFHFDVPHNFK